jgi:hypothetical protein
LRKAFLAPLKQCSTQRSEIRRRVWNWLVILALLALMALGAFYLLRRAGSFLIVNAPQHSDLILVMDARWQKAEQLYKQGYAPMIMVDADTTHRLYGKTEAELLMEMLARNRAVPMQICPTKGDSKYEEAADVWSCIRHLPIRSVLIVNADFDTRRSLSLMRKRLPQYRWSIAASSAPYHDADQYWKHRIWAKSVLTAWEDYLWWKLVDQWRSDVVLR